MRSMSLTASVTTGSGKHLGVEHRDLGRQRQHLRAVVEIARHLEAATACAAGDEGVSPPTLTTMLGSLVSWCMSMTCTIERSSCSAVQRRAAASGAPRCVTRKNSAAPISTMMLAWPPRCPAEPSRRCRPWWTGGSPERQRASAATAATDDQQRRRWHAQRNVAPADRLGALRVLARRWHAARRTPRRGRRRESVRTMRWCSAAIVSMTLAGSSER